MSKGRELMRERCKVTACVKSTVSTTALTLQVWIAMVAAVMFRPSLWWTAHVVALRFAPERWWRRPPFLPLPSGELMRFRSETMYGDATMVPTSNDIVAWLEWCRAQRKAQ